MYALKRPVGSGVGKPYELPQNSVMPRVRMWEKASMYSSQPPLKLLSKNRCGWRRRCSGSRAHERPAREVDERQPRERPVRARDQPRVEEHQRQPQAAPPLHGAEDGDADRLPVDVARVGARGRQRPGGWPLGDRHAPNLRARRGARQRAGDRRQVLCSVGARLAQWRTRSRPSSPRWSMYCTRAVMRAASARRVRSNSRLRAVAASCALITAAPVDRALRARRLRRS